MHFRFEFGHFDGMGIGGVFFCFWKMEWYQWKQLHKCINVKTKQLHTIYFLSLFFVISSLTASRMSAIQPANTRKKITIYRNQCCVCLTLLAFFIIIFPIKGYFVQLYFYCHSTQCRLYFFLLCAFFTILLSFTDHLHFQHQIFLCLSLFLALELRFQIWLSHTSKTILRFTCRRRLSLTWFWPFLFFHKTKIMAATVFHLILRQNKMDFFVHIWIV